MTRLWTRGLEKSRCPHEKVGRQEPLRWVAPHERTLRPSRRCPDRRRRRRRRRRGRECRQGDPRTSETGRSRGLRDQRGDVLTKALKRPPRDIATDLAQRSRTTSDRSSTASPSPVPVSSTWCSPTRRSRARWLRSSRRAKPSAPRSGPCSQGERRVREREPDGPLHVGHTRNAAYGDALARISSCTATRSRGSSTSTTTAPRS